jgi:hypothetical protein
VAVPIASGKAQDILFRIKRLVQGFQPPGNLVAHILDAVNQGHAFRDSNDFFL